MVGWFSDLTFVPKNSSILVRVYMVKPRDVWHLKLPFEHSIYLVYLMFTTMLNKRERI